MLMGRGLEKLECIPAGNIFGLGGIKDHILKTATLSSEPFCFPLSSVQFVSSIPQPLGPTLEATNHSISSVPVATNRSCCS